MLKSFRCTGLFNIVISSPGSHMVLFILVGYVAMLWPRLGISGSTGTLTFVHLNSTGYMFDHSACALVEGGRQCVFYFGGALDFQQTFQLVHPEHMHYARSPGGDDSVMVSPSSNPLVLHHLPISSLWISAPPLVERIALHHLPISLLRISVPPPVECLIQFTTCLFRHLGSQCPLLSNASLFTTCLFHHFGSRLPLLSNASLFTTCLFRHFGSRRPLLANPSEFFTTCLFRHCGLQHPFLSNPSFATCLFHHLDHGVPLVDPRRSIRHLPISLLRSIVLEQYHL